MDIKKPLSTFLDDISVTSNTTFENNLVILNEILKRLNNYGMQVNSTKSILCTTGLEFLGYHPLKKRIESILSNILPKTFKLVTDFVGLVNFIKNHIPGHAKTLEPIIKLTKKKMIFTWGEEQQKAFNKIKADAAESILLSY